MRIIESVDDSDLNYGKESGKTQDLMKRLALIMARSSAVNYGRKLTSEEMEHIVVNLFSLPHPSYTPNGSKIFHTFDVSNIQSLLKG